MVAAVAAPAFLVVEHRRAHPMLPLGLFRSRQFSGANAVTFAVYGALGGALFLLPVELQIVDGLLPRSQSGLALLPLTLVMLALSARSGALSARIGPRLQMTVGPLVVGAGLVLLARATDPGSYWTQVFPAVLRLRLRPGRHGRPPDRDRHGRRAARALRHRLGRQQRRGPGRRPARRRGPAAPGRPDRCRRPRSATELAAGFRTAMVISGVTCAAGGVLAALTIRNPARAAGARRSRARRAVPGPAASAAPARPGAGGRRGAGALSPTCGGAPVRQR